MSRAVRDLLEQMMDVNPDTRITAEQILEHKWITDNEKLIQNIFYDQSQEEEE
jgi:serine/threonine protein kinase